MGRGAEKFRRIKRRKIGTGIIMVPLKRRPSGVNDERRQSKKDQERLRPPDIGPHCLPEPSRNDGGGCCFSHAPLRYRRAFRISREVWSRHALVPGYEALHVPNGLG